MSGARSTIFCSATLSSMGQNHITILDVGPQLSCIVPWFGGTHYKSLLILYNKVAMPATQLKLPHVFDSCSWLYLYR